MKLIILLPAVMGLVAAQSDQDTYVTGDDYYDIESVIADINMLRSYSDCFLDKGPCNPITQSYRDIIQDSVIRACDRCNVPQKQRYGRFILALRNLLPLVYQEFRRKYDPENIYFDAFEAEMSQFWSTPLIPRPTS